MVHIAYNLKVVGVFVRFVRRFRRLVCTQLLALSVTKQDLSNVFQYGRSRQ
jgi:hypothetical protein